MAFDFKKDNDEVLKKIYKSTKKEPYPLMLEDRSSRLWSYNLETILAEKLQTVLARGVLNTRMRDFYDIRILLTGYAETINPSVFTQAFHATCKKRKTLDFGNQGDIIIDNIGIVQSTISRNNKNERDNLSSG